MRHAIVQAGLVLALALVPAAAAAKDIPAGGLSINDVAAWLQADGYKAGLETTKSGETNVDSSADGHEFHIHMYDCKKAKCASLQFFVGVDTKGALTAAKINAFNKANRWARAYVDDVNDPWLEYDVDLSPGGTFEQLDDEFAIWRQASREFYKAIGK